MIRKVRRQVLALSVLVFSMTAVLENAAHAVEPYVEFVQGLRDRKFYDYTLLYLDTLKDDAAVPDEIRQVIPYEKAQTLLVMAREGVTNPEVQGRQLEQALGYLKEFREKNPNHPKFGEAATEEARILLGQARVEVWQSRSPGNKENRAEFQQKARGLVVEARKIFQDAHDKHKATWEAFPKFIDKVEEPEQFAQRSTAETQYILAQLDLANCTYEEGQTWDENSTEYAAKLRDAAQEYEDIHSKYRSMLGGLYARTWQGKCFEEQDDIDRAVGIYKELLGHPGTSEAMQRLQDQVLQFYLICLNHEKKKDYQLVVDRATDWFKQAKGRRKFSAIAIGIKWENVLALESLAADRTADESDRKRSLTTALGMVRDVKRFPGRYKDLAVFKERDLMVLLRGEGALEDPEDFNTAFGLAQELVTKKTKELQAKNDEAKGSKDADVKRKAAEDWQNHLDRTTHLLKLCLRLSDEKTAINDLNLTRYYLAFMHLLSRRNYEAAILAEFIAINYGKDNPVQAQDSAYMALGGYVQAFNDNGKARRKDDQKIDVTRMTAMANLLTERWPSSDRATDARLQLGTVYAELKDHEKAALSYSQVPVTAAKYTDAQKRAGQAYWAAYIEAANLPPETQPTQAQLDDWMAKAEQHLITGIEREEASTPPATPASDALIFAKVSRVQIIVAKGDYEGAVKLLTGEPHPVIAAIQVKDGSEESRPKTGIKSVPFASLAYQLLLRSYVGTGQLTEARDAMKGLEAVGGGDGEQITEMYKSLGKELQNELERLKGLNQTQQLMLVRKSFETFLGEMFKRPDQTAGSLTWIAETYYGLAQGTSDDPAQSSTYFERAADTYQKILDKSAEDATFVEARRLMGVRLRLANCRRYQGSHELAMTLLKEILGSDNGENYLDAQIEAASTLQSWGETDSEKLVQARSGLKIAKEDRAKVWGWARLAGMLQRKMQMSPGDKEKFQTKLYDARYNLSLCKQLQGEAQSTPAKKKEDLSAARAEIFAFVQITPDIPDDYWDKFDALYGKILTGLGEPVVALERPKQIQPMTQADRKKQQAAEKKAEKIKVAAEVSKKPEEDSSTTLILFGVVALLGLGGGGFFVMKGSKGGRRTPAYAAAVPDDLVITPPPAAPARRKRPAGDRPQPGRSPAAGPQAAAPAAGQATAPQQARRPLTPEEREKRARMKAAKAKAEQRKKRPDPPPQ